MVRSDEDLLVIRVKREESSEKEKNFPERFGQKKISYYLCSRNSKIGVLPSVAEHRLRKKQRRMSQSRERDFSYGEFGQKKISYYLCSPCPKERGIRKGESAAA